jgi:hypothetical protein
MMKNQMNRNSGRRADGTFAPGNPGRPIGTRHKATLAATALLDGEAELLTRAAIDKAKEGDSTALRLCLERLVPTRKESPIQIELPKITTATDAVEASSIVVEAVSSGEITPSEGEVLQRLINSLIKSIELHDLERRIAALEGK